MSDRLDQAPGLFPPLREWTAGGIVGGLVLAALVLLPWFFLFVLIWALLSAPEAPSF